MFKKVGMVTVGITAGLLAAAPLASAGEAPQDGHGQSQGDQDGKKKQAGNDCNINGGNAVANGGIGGDAVAGALAQAPVASNIGNIVCSDILNDNLSGNNLSISILGADDEEEAVTASEGGDAPGAGAADAGTAADGAVSQEDIALPL